MTPETALLAAVQAALLASPAVTALVGEKVFDQVPGDDEPGRAPLIYVGPIARQRLLDPAGEAAWTMTLRLFVESTSFGRTEAWEIADTAGDFLEAVELELDDPFACAEPMRITKAGDVFTEKGFRTVYLDLATTVQKVE